MSKDAIDNNLRQVIRDLTRRISALERQQNDVGDLNEIANSVSFGDGEVIIDQNGLTIKSATSSEDKNNIKYVDPDTTDLLAYLYSTYSATRARIGLVANGVINRTEGGAALVSYSDLGGSVTAYSTVEAIATATDQYVTIYPKGAFGDTGALTGGAKTINDDAAFSFTPATSRGVLIFRSGGANTTIHGLFTYAAVSGTAYCYAWTGAGSAMVASTGAKTGTTGTDGKVTVSAHTDGKIYIENRSGGQQPFAWQIVAGA
jgi:hypothetical protein